MRGICSWLFGLAVVCFVSGGCEIEKGRFATCDNDEDCKGTDETRPYCENLRCVACAYDRHCKDGEVCDTNSKTCSAL